MGELTGQRARNVTAPHAVALVQEEWEGQDSAEGRDGERTADPAEREQGADWECERTRERSELERHRKWNRKAQGGDQQEGEGKIEKEEGIPGEITRHPADEFSIRQEVIPQIPRHNIVIDRVAASRDRRSQEEGGFEVPEQESVSQQEGEERTRPSLKVDLENAGAKWEDSEV